MSKHLFANSSHQILDAEKALSEIAEVLEHRGVLIKDDQNATGTVLKRPIAHYSINENVDAAELVDAAKIIVNYEQEAIKVDQSFLELEANSGFVTASESDLVHLKRFIEKRDRLLADHQFLDASEFGLRLNSEDTHPSRTLKRYRQMFAVLAVQVGSHFRYPMFQLDSEAKPFTALTDVLAKLNNAGRSHWDICFWLLEPQAIIFSQPSPGDLSGKSFEAMLKISKRISNNTKAITDTPLAMLRAGKTDEFNAMVADWISPDQRQIVSG